MSTSSKDKIDNIKRTEKIFMLEVIIQKVFIDVIEMSDFAFSRAETCVSYTFLDYGPFGICEKDFTYNVQQGGCAGCGTLKNGNSTMFPLFPETMETIKEKGFILKIALMKMLKPMPKIVGKTDIDMQPIFEAVMDAMINKVCDSASKSMKNRYKLKDTEDDPVGYVDLFIRLSSMGKIIVTKFQMDMRQECVEFQSNSGNTYQYKKKPCSDDMVCKPCGAAKQAISPYERETQLPSDFPAMRVTEDMKKRLQERHEIEEAKRNESIALSGKGKGGKGKHRKKEKGKVWLAGPPLKDDTDGEEGKGGKGRKGGNGGKDGEEGQEGKEGDEEHEEDEDEEENEEIDPRNLQPSWASTYTYDEDRESDQERPSTQRESNVMRTKSDPFRFFRRSRASRQKSNPEIKRKSQL